MAKRRANGEGNLRQRPNGLWELTIMDGYRPDGKRKTKSFYGKTQKEVKAKSQAYLSDKEQGLKVDCEYLFCEWADIWLEGHKENITPTTQESYSYTLRVLKDQFQGRQLRDIKPVDIEIMLRNVRDSGRSSSFLAQCRGMMFQIMHKAEANDLIRKNPVQFAEKMRDKDPPKRKEAFSAEEVRTMMRDLPEDRIGWSIRLLLGTGMRTQELLALEPKHIEPDGSVIHIVQAINMQKGTPVVGTPKSRDSYRDVPVPENLRWCAMALRDTDTRYIWESRKKDSPCNPSHFVKKFKEAIGAIPGVRVLTPHSCRHTYVSQMQALGVDLATIQSLVGHADIDMTEHYLHVQEPIRQDAIARFSRAFDTGHYDPEPPDGQRGKIIPFPMVG